MTIISRVRLFQFGVQLAADEEGIFSGWRCVLRESPRVDALLSGPRLCVEYDVQVHGARGVCCVGDVGEYCVAELLGDGEEGW